MPEQTWRNVLTPEGLQLVAAEELDDVVALMIQFRIDPQKFGGNLLTLVSRGRPSIFASISDGNDSLPSTPSIGKYESIVDRPGAPLWLLAAFPDVMAWFNESRLETMEPQVRQNDLYRNLVAKYLSETGRTLETAVEEGAPGDIYLGFDLLKMAGEQSNFTLIATNTTKYYLELKRSFGASFPDETALLAMSGIMDAFVYIARQEIVAEYITELARQTEGKQNRLLQFLIKFEAILLSIDTPSLSFEEVAQHCEEQAEAIRGAIAKVMRSYSGDSTVANDVKAAMSAPHFKTLRYAAGLRNPSLLWKLKKLFG